MSKPNKGSFRWLLATTGIFIATKLKWVIGLIKLSKFGGTLISMIISVGAYALASPLEFAIGFVLLIFIHELGHVIAAKQKGVPASAPLFIPFLGALITMKKNPRDAVTEAYIAFGGPLIGSIGAWIVGWLGIVMKNDLLLHLAYTGVFINLINLLPIHPLDGGRISVAVTRWLWLVGLVGGLWIILQMQAWFFLFIWALFAYELYQKFVKFRNRRKPMEVNTSIRVMLDPERSFWIPGEEHRAQLQIRTYTTLEGEQKIELEWPIVGMQETLHLNYAILVDAIEVYGVKKILDAEGHVVAADVKVVIRGRQYEAEDYYDVPLNVRLSYGAAYLGLAGALGWSLYYIGIITVA